MDYAVVIDEVFSQFSGQKFSVRFWDAHERVYGTEGDSSFTLVFENEAAARRLFGEGALGFGEAYMDGTLRIEGDVESYLRMRHQFKHVRGSLRLACAVLFAKLTSPFTRKEQIAKHYDLGNDFFKMILDADTMSYSAGKYKTGNEALSEAQKYKLEYIGELLKLPEHAKVLDLGSGWGGFARYASETRKWRITGYTLSRAQLAYCAEQNIPNTSFMYRDMVEPIPTAAFDGVVALESIEHVGQNRLTAYFKNICAALRPGGVAYIQATGRYVAKAVDPWTLKYVFPGGYLPTKDELVTGAESAGFSISVFQDDTSDYIRTMGEWIQNLERNKDAIEQKFDPAFYRLWHLWMHGAKVSFETGSMNLFRMSLKRPMSEGGDAS